MRRSFSRGVGVLTLLVALALPATAQAAPATADARPIAALATTTPVTLESGRVLDQANVISSAQESEITSAINTLNANTKSDLWVVFVDNFTSPTGASEWAAATAEANNLGDNQFLLAVAVSGRSYALSAANNGPITVDQRDSIETDLIAPALRNGDYAGAAVAAAQGLDRAISGKSVTGESSSGGGLTWVIGLIFVALIVLIVVMLVRRRRKAAAPVAGAVPQVSLEELERTASRLLVQTDDAVKAAELELGFAQAQYGTEASAEFATILANAKKGLGEAFTLQQKLNDSEPDSEAQIRQWNSQIIQICESSSEALTAQIGSFENLRVIEKDVPGTIAKIAEERARISTRLEPAQASLAALGQRFAPEALSTVDDNVAQAQERLTFAEHALSVASEKTAAADPSSAAVALRAAGEANAQADALLTAIEHASTELTNSSGEVQSMLIDLEQDVVAARALPDPQGRYASVIAGTEAAVTAAKTSRDPIRTLERLQQANTAIDELLAFGRDQQVSAARAASALQSTLVAAQSQVAAAEDYITARRGAVGAQARTALAEAGRNLVQAQQIAQSDPATALSYAQRAQQLGGQAIQLAQQDVGGFGGGGGGGNANSSGIGGAILGGIIINSLLGGGGGGGMFGGGGGGGFGGGGGGGGFGGGGGRMGGGGGRF